MLLDPLLDLQLVIIINNVLELNELLAIVAGDELEVNRPLELNILPVWVIETSAFGY